MGAGPLRIPSTGIIEQTTQAAAEPRRFPRAEAPHIVSPLGEAGRQLDEAGRSIANVLGIQARQQQIMDISQAGSGLADGLNQAADDARSQQGSQQVDYFNKQAQQLLQQTRDQYKDNPAVTSFLDKRGPLMVGTYLRHVQTGAITRTAQEHDQQLKAFNTSDATHAAADFQLNPDGSFGDGPNAQAARAQAYGRIDQMWPNDKTMASAYKQDFENKVAPARAQFIAQNHPELIDKYLKSQPAGQFNAEQIQNFQSIARNAIELPYHNVTAQQEANKARTETALTTMQQNDDPGLYQSAYQAAKAGYITHERFEDLTNTKWQGPKAQSDPETMTFWKQKILTDPNSVSAADIAAIDKDTISPGDRAALRAQRDDAIQGLRKPMMAQYIRSRTAIREQLTPSISVNAEREKLRVEGALSDLDAAYKGGDLKSVKDIQDMQDSIIQANTKGRPPRKAPTIHVTAPGGGPMSPAVAAKVAAEARAKGFEMPAGPGGE